MGTRSAVQAGHIESYAGKWAEAGLGVSSCGEQFGCVSGEGSITDRYPCIRWTAASDATTSAASPQRRCKDL